MTTFDKLNLKQHAEIAVLNAPASFEPQLAGLRGVQVHRTLSKFKQIDFILAFVTRQSEVDALIPKVVAKTTSDAILWFAYPKGTSKRYTCDFNRDTGWDALRAAGFDTVRAVAIDEDWSALRFRRIAFIKSSTRRPAS
jgi:hypothetical protein